VIANPGDFIKCRTAIFKSRKRDVIVTPHPEG
jgi:hypothetical protein